MKTLIICFLLMSNSAIAQRATISNDTAKYNDKSYVVGDTIHLGYGSNENKSFAFIQIGSMLGGTNSLQKSYSKYDAVIDKVSKKGQQVILRAKFTDNAAAGNKLFIDLEGAIDNKELR